MANGTFSDFPMVMNPAGTVNVFSLNLILLSRKVLSESFLTRKSLFINRLSSSSEVKYVLNLLMLKFPVTFAGWVYLSLSSSTLPLL
jgi:hypothetical protein